MSNPDKLDIVRKLLAKAERAATPEEAEAYTAKAVELIARHGIDEALLAAKADVRQVPGTRKIDIDGSYTHEKGNLLGWLMEALGGKVVLHIIGGGRRGSKTKVRSATLIGFEADMARAELLYTSLLVQAMGQLGSVRPPFNPHSWDEPSPSTVAAFRRSWFLGFASQVSGRVREAEHNVVAEVVATTGTSTELVLMDRRAQVERYRDELFPNLTSGKDRKVNDQAYAQGSHAGSRADIGNKRVGSTKRALT